MKRSLHALAGLAAGGGLLWLLFRNTHWDELWKAAEHASLPWVLVSTGLLIFSYYLRAQRWTYVVRAAQPVSFRCVFSTTQIGALAMPILPARLGEFVRPALLTRMTGIPFSKTVSMTAVDRVLDLIGLFVMLLITMAVFKPVDCVIPEETFGWRFVVSASQMRRGEYMAGAFVVGLVSLFIVLCFARAHVLALTEGGLRRFFPKTALRIQNILSLFLDGLSMLRSPRNTMKALVFSLLTWTVCTLAFAAMMQAFQIRGPWYAALAIELFLILGVALPVTPALIGQYQAPIVIGLMMLTSANDATAKAFAIVAQVADVLPTFILGFACLYYERFGLADLKREAAAAREESAHDH